MFDINKITRENVKKLQPYSSARDEFKGSATVWLDANESPYPNSCNRYPDSSQKILKEKISVLKKIPSKNIFLGNGSDEAIDLIIRAFCEPHQDEILIFPPTYGMYEVSANINAVGISSLPLREDFSLDEEKISETIKNNKRIKLIFICSPNNPTGNITPNKIIKNIAQQFNGIVVIDEAYIDFSITDSFLSEINSIPNAIVLQTFSKAWGMAGARLGMAFSSPDIISILNKIKPPYNINILTQNEALKTIENQKNIYEKINIINQEKNKMEQKLNDLDIVENIFPSEANFLLIQCKHSNEIYKTLAQQGIVIRNRGQYVKNALRISIGIPEGNETLIKALQKINSTILQQS